MLGLSHPLQQNSGCAPDNSSVARGGGGANGAIAVERKKESGSTKIISPN